MGLNVKLLLLVLMVATFSYLSEATASPEFEDEDVASFDNEFIENDEDRRISDFEDEFEDEEEDDYESDEDTRKKNKIQTHITDFFKSKPTKDEDDEDTRKKNKIQTHITDFFKSKPAKDERGNFNPDFFVIIVKDGGCIRSYQVIFGRVNYNDLHGSCSSKRILSIAELIARKKKQGSGKTTTTTTSTRKGPGGRLITKTTTTTTSSGWRRSPITSTRRNPKPTIRWRFTPPSSRRQNPPPSSRRRNSRQSSRRRNQPPSSRRRNSRQSSRRRNQPSKPKQKLTHVPASKFRKVQKLCLDAHNHYRSQYGLPNVTTDTGAARFAQKLAEKNQKAGRLIHDGAGENLAWGMDSRGFSIKEALDKAVRGWYMEICDLNTWNGGNNCDIEKWQKVGHMSQLLWGPSTKIGCGLTIHHDGTQYNVATSYKPAGNYQNQYHGNVPTCHSLYLEKKKMKAACDKRAARRG